MNVEQEILNALERGKAFGFAEGMRHQKKQQANRIAELEKSKERLCRIMGTFDLATGHADTFTELLDSLEVELRDVLGHQRQRISDLEKELHKWANGDYRMSGD